MPSNTEIYKDREIHEVHLNKVSMFIFTFFLLWFTLTIVVLANQIFSFFEIESRFTQWKFLGCVLGLFIFHEALHAFAAMVWGKAPWSSIHFGFKWQWLAFYCNCDEPLKIGIFRLAILFPLIVTTPTAGLILWLAPSTWSLLLFCVTISACAGDILMFFKIRQFKNDKWIREHSSEPILYILSEAVSVSPEEYRR